MRRYKHWYYRTRGKAQPAAIVCVEVDVQVHRAATGVAEETETLTRWHATSAVRKDGNYVHVKHATHVDAAEFWKRLESLSRLHAPVWVFCSRAPRVWSALGLWDAVETGRVLLGSTGTPRAGTVGAALPAARSALLVLEDPTNAVGLRFPAVPGRVTLVDLRNYGVDLVAAGLKTRDRLAAGYAFVTQMIQALDAGALGALQVTVSSQALYTYRHRFMSHTMHVHCHAKALALEESSYHGGRCEAYQIGSIKGKVHHLDFTSLYAACCQREEVPCQLRWYAEFDPPCEVMSLAGDPPDTADVLLETAEPFYPYAHSGLVVYPVGTFRTVLTGPELQFCWNRGHIHRIYRAAWYHKRRALKAFADYFLQRRADMAHSDMPHMALWCKRLLVGLVGKLGQRGGQWIDLPADRFEYPWDAYTRLEPGIGPVKYRRLAGRLQKELPAQWGPESVPAAAAWITSAGRWALTAALASAGWPHCYYCDTDSIMCDTHARLSLEAEDLVRDREPGKLRLVETSKGAEISGWKSYTAGSRSACSGVPKGSTESHQSPFYAWITTWLPAALRQKRAPDARRKLIQVSHDRPYRHGVLLGTGRTRPFLLPDELPLIKGV